MDEHEHEHERKIIEHKEVIVSLPVIHAPGWLQGFLDFMREQGVVGVAVGLIIGLGAKTLVDSFVANFVNPIVGIILGSTTLAAKSICLKTSPAGVCISKIGYGQFLNDLISFVIIAAIVYFVIKGLKLEKLDKAKSK